MIARGIPFVVGALILAAVAHVTIEMTGGYGTAHAFLTMAVALGVACASYYAGNAWADRRVALALFLILTIGAGEAYNLLGTADRIVTSREQQQAPLREQASAIAKADKEIADAKKALESAPTSSKDLTDAKAAKDKADAAVVAQASERGCRENCRQLLQAQVDNAAADVTKATAALAVTRAKLEKALEDKRTARAILKPPPSATPFADRVGVPPWLLDLTMAALGSMAANGLACGLIGYAAHRKKIEVVAAEIVEPANDNVIRSKKRTAPSAKAHAAEFGNDCLSPEGSGADLEEIRKLYGDWCYTRGLKALPDAQIGQALSDLFDQAGIQIAERNGRWIAVGVAIKQPVKMLRAESR